MLRGGHYINKCKMCQTITSQCRCPSKDKPVYDNVCVDCMVKHKVNINGVPISECWPNKKSN